MRGDWPQYGGDLGGSRYSPLAQITPQNVSGLKEAWRLRLGDKIPGTGLEATPLMAGGSLYLCTPTRIVAVDPETGALRWSFDPKVKLPAVSTCRGVAYYAAPGAAGPCASRIIFATSDARLMAVDARDGAPCRGFGAAGVVDQTQGLGHPKPGYWRTSSAPVVVRGKVVLGGWVTDNQYVGEPSGVVRAYDAVTGRLAWAWDAEHPEGLRAPPPSQAYAPGTPNSWAPISGDEDLGLVYLPTGNSTPDYWGAHRSAGSERYASAVVAVEAETGRTRWAFQTAHHDVWDYDVASQPTLVEARVGGAAVPALIQATKRGQVFLLDRRTGAPLSAVVEKPAPQGGAPGERLSPTQPFSTGMPSFDGPRLSERRMWGLTPLDELWCRIRFRQVRYDGLLTPPGLRPSIEFPGAIGAMNWGGVSVDPERRLVVVNWNLVPHLIQLVPRARADALGVRPTDNGLTQSRGFVSAQAGTPFAAYNQFFLSPLGAPCSEPPFGKIAAFDLDTRQVRWARPLGSSAELGPLGLASHLRLPMGVPNLGGSVVTRSGLAFIGATMEREFRAFAVEDGRKLWAVRLPEQAVATPMSYLGPRSGRQFVVVAADGGAASTTARGQYLIAYALAESRP
jgi:membrane-bound PQQ-dependent dehydrogenase (glucose/quinate/shikimate family)